MATGIQSVTDDSGNTVIYYFDKDGIRRSGLINYNNSTYYFDEETCERCAGWVTIDGEEYYFDASSGKMSKGLTAIDDWYYYFNTDTGAKETGLISYEGRYYYASEDTDESDDGLCYGLTEINGQTYYFNTSGYATTGYLNLDGVRYYFDSDTGASVSGVYWVTSSIAYAFAAGGGCQSGMVEFNGNTYFATLSTGKIVTGLHSIGDVLYYFDSDGHMLKNTQVEVSGITYVIDENGSLSVTGDSSVARLISSAIEKLGTPYGSENAQSDYYVEDSSGAYSCSGLASAVLADAGIDVRATAYLQYYSLTHDGYDVTTVSSTDDLKPGDIIYICGVECQYSDDCTFWNEIHHVAIYIGGGKVLESIAESNSGQSGVVIRDLADSATSFVFAIVRCNDLN